MDGLERGSEHAMKSEDPDALTDIDGVLEKLSLTRVHMGDYLVIVRSNFDMTVTGEPYIATMLLMNLWSKHFIARIWNRTVMTGSVGSKVEFEEACKTLFDQGKPCLGYIEDEKHSQVGQEFVISQTPFPRKISKGCQQLMGKDVESDSVSCPKCLMLGNHIADNGFQDEVETIADAEELGSVALINEKIEYDDSEFKIQETNATEFLSLTARSQDTDNHVRESEEKIEIGIIDDDNDWSGAEDMNKDGKAKDGTSLIQCPWCDQKFIKNPYHHYKLAHFLGKFKCAECSFIANFAKDLVDHMQKNGHIKHVACPNCSSTIEDNRISLDTFSHEDITSHYKDCVRQLHECGWCGFTSPYVGKMSDHKKRSHFWGPFKCYHCEYFGDFATDLVKHMAEAHNLSEGYATCPSCKSCMSIQIISNHYEDCVNKNFPKKGCNKNRKCQYCEMKYVSSMSLKRHMTKAHGWGHFKCSECSHEASSVKDMLDHLMAREHKIQMLDCPICKNKYALGEILSHYKSCPQIEAKKIEYQNKKDWKKNKGFGFTCDICDKKYTSVIGLSTHKKVKHLWGVFRCMTCNRKAYYVENLLRHINEEGHSQHALCPANSCGQKIALPEMRTHYEKCIGEWNVKRNIIRNPRKNLVCEICGKKFKAKQGYNQHLATFHHPNDDSDKPAYYCEKCGKKYDAEYKLRKHVRESHGEKINCKICDYSSVKELMKAHMLKHEEAKFKCGICGKMLKKKDSLIIHEREHAGIKPFSCHICGKSFPGQIGLKQHKRLVHQIVGPNDNVKPMKSELKRGITKFIVE